LTRVGGQYQPNPFDVVATILNTGSAAAQDVQLTLYPPPGLSLATGSETQSISSLASGQQQQVTWSVRAAGQKTPTTLSYFVSVIAANTPGKSASGQTMLPGGVLSVEVITPSSGGNTGSVSATIYGGGFLTGANARLARAGQPDIVGSAINVSSDGCSLTSTFDLKGKLQGPWDVFVTNPDGTSAKLAGGITIVQGLAADVWVDVLGHPAVKADHAQPYTIMYGNRGNTDSGPVLLWISFPKSLTWSLPDGETPTASVETVDGNRVFAINVPVVPAGAIKTIRLRLTAPLPAGVTFTITARRELF
jgi:hypothetical protein